MTTIDSNNICREKELTNFIFSDNNIAENIFKSKDKYKFLIKEASVNISQFNKIIIKIVKDNTIIYNQLFENDDYTDGINNIVSNELSHTIFSYTYENNVISFTKFWIYIPKCLFSNQLADVPANIVTDLSSNIVADVPANIVADLSSNIVADVPANIVADLSSNIVADVPSDLSEELINDFTNQINIQSNEKVLVFVDDIVITS
jgi:hypothetical protein